MKVSIILLNWNGLEDTTECLNSLKELTYPNYNVVVVDNNSEGDDVKVLKEEFGPYIHIIENDRNYGFADGCNIGMRYALENCKPDYLLLLNNDTIVDKNLVTELVKVAEESPMAGLVGGKIFYYNNPERIQFVWGNLHLRRGEVIEIPQGIVGKFRKVEYRKGEYDLVRSVDWITGCCFLIKKEVIENVGFLDEDYSYYWEDVDYCLRTKRKGYKIIYTYKGKVWHKLAKGISRVHGRIVYYSVRNRFLFMRKNASKREYLYFLLYFFGLYFWATVFYYLVFYRDPSLLLCLFRAARDGLFRLYSGEKFYSGPR